MGQSIGEPIGARPFVLLPPRNAESKTHGAVDPRFAGVVARAGAALTAALLAPAAVAVLRLFPPLALWTPGAPSWIGPLAAGTAAVAVGAGAAACLADGLRQGRLVRFIEAGALGALAAGLGGGAFRAASEPAAFPDGGLPLAMVATALLLLAARLVPSLDLTARGRRVALVGAAIVVEGVLAATLFSPVSPAVAPWLSAAAAGVAAAASVPGPMVATGLLAGAFAAMTAMRPGALDAIAPLAAMLAAGVAFAWRRSLPEDVGEGVGLAPALAPPAEPKVLTGGVTLVPRAVDDEALRLARELRGTIEELLQARRTIELQREELARTAERDALTGVATRRVVVERLATEAAESRRYTHPVAVVLIDVDGFAQLNRDHGLAVGDAVLRELALRLRLRMRAADALGRVGGDSFMAILPHTDERGAAVFADALRRRLIARPISTDAGELTIAISIGVAFMRPGMVLTADELLAAADEALASARAAGGNRIAFDRQHGFVRLEDRRPGSASEDRSGRQRA
jgi:diguanylate cyclase (GGDEF)-like protein